MTFNQPEKRNAMSIGMWDGMAEALDAFEADPAVRCVVLEGAGGIVVKYDQFGALPPSIREGEEVTLGWALDSGVLHR